MSEPSIATIRGWKAGDFERAYAAALRALSELAKEWEAVEGAGMEIEGAYPPYLPSFDELVTDLYNHRDTLQFRVR